MMAVKMNDENFRNSCREICYETMKAIQSRANTAIIFAEEHCEVQE